MDSQFTKDKEIINPGSFPLKSLLQLYLKSPKDRKGELYFYHFKLLQDWLGPTFSYRALPEFTFHHLLVSFEIEELSRRLNIPYHIIYFTLIEILYPSSPK